MDSNVAIISASPSFPLSFFAGISTFVAPILSKYHLTNFSNLSGVNSDFIASRICWLAFSTICE